MVMLCQLPSGVVDLMKGPSDQVRLHGCVCACMCAHVWVRVCVCTLGEDAQYAHAPLVRSLLTTTLPPRPQVNVVLAKVDDWQFDSFQLCEVSGGRPLSCLAFALLKKSGLVPGRFGLSESKLAK